MPITVNIQPSRMASQGPSPNIRADGGIPLISLAALATTTGGHEPLFQRFAEYLAASEILRCPSPRWVAYTARSMPYRSTEIAAGSSRTSTPEQVYVND